MKRRKDGSPAEDLKIVVCMPAYNEEKYIGSTILKVRRYCKDIFVVDDCSRDNTGRIAKMAGAMVVRHKSNQGYGGALRTCFKVGKEQGRWAAETTLRVLDGERPGDIPVTSNVQTEAYVNATLAARIGFKPALEAYRGVK